MPLLNAEDVQILLLELQPPIVASSRTLDPARLRRATAALATVAGAAGIPITASIVPMGDDPSASSLIEELAGVVPMVRRTIGALGDQGVADRLASLGRRVIVLGGVSSEIAVLHAALEARAAGYDVHVLVDLCGGLDARTERAAMSWMRDAGVTQSNVSSFATSLFADMATELGGAVMRALATLWGWDAHGADGEDAPAGSEHAELDEPFAAMRAGWRDGDAARFAAAFTRDARFVAYDGTVLAGEAEAAWYAPHFAGRLAGTELVLEPTHVRSVAEGVVLVGSAGGVVRVDRRGKRTPVAG